MASSVIHMAVANEINKKLKRNANQLLIGSVAPDLSKIVGETRLRSHFLDSEDTNIPNIDKFLANHFVKYRVWIGESYKDVEMTKSYAKKFNNRLKEAAKEVTQKYNEKQNTLDNPLEGF